MADSPEILTSIHGREFGLDVNGDLVWNTKNGRGNFTSAQAAAVAAIGGSGVDVPGGVPTPAVGAAGVLTGAYYYLSTFVLDDGTETGPATLTPTLVSPSSQQVNLTTIFVSPSARVVARRLYRTIANPGSGQERQCQLLTTINDNTTTTYTDNAADGTLGAFIPWIGTTDGVLKIRTLRTANFIGVSTGLGQFALEAGTGYANTALGAYAMRANTSGYRNTAVGVFALTSITTGSQNTAVGVHALNTLSTSNFCTAFGYSALFTHNGAGINTAVGWASQNVTTGAGGQNTSVGYRTLTANTSGVNNTAIGHDALRTNISGQGMTACGDRALQLGTGNFSVAVGSSSQFNASSGTGNVSIGYQSLLAVTTASGSVALGHLSGKYATAGNELYIDNQDRVDLNGGQTLSLIYGVFAATAIAQRVALNALVKHVGTTVASLPAASGALQGYRGYVTDANATTFYSTVAGGGANSVPVFCNGTAWVIA